MRDHEVENNHFYLDPCNLHPGEADVVADRLVEELTRARERKQSATYSAAERKASRFQRLLQWPD